MAINKTSKLGPLLGVDLNSMNRKTGEVPEVKPEKEEVKTPSAPQPQSPSKESASNMGRPKFELIAGMPEKKVNFHCPEDLFWAINKEASNQHITNKQLICEMLLEVMTTKYGFKLK